MFKLVFSIFFLMMVVQGELFADGGTVQISQEKGPFRITVFTTSAIVRAGPEDISVLVQDRETHQPILNAAVRLSFQRLDDASPVVGEAWMPPCCRMKPEAALLKGMEATHQLATNKLLYAVTTVLPEAGEWEVKTEVQTATETASVTGQLRVEPPAPPMLVYWPYFFMPIASIAGFVLHFNLRRKRYGESHISK